jgi:L-threonate 2-dehydrogenase
LQKDTRLAMEAARRLGLPGVLGAPAAQAFADASAAGWQAHDDGALLQWLRQLPTMPP